MKLKLLLAYTVTTQGNKDMFYMKGNYNEGAVLRYQCAYKNTGFYVGRKNYSEFNKLNTYLKKL